MSFLYPAFLLGALAVALPIALHLLRRDVAPEVPFSAVRLLRRSPIDRTRHRRLRDLVLLIARVTALTVLALAFARPYLIQATDAAGLRIIAIDRSFSMGAPGQFARAVSLARSAVDEAALTERVAVVAFDDRADVIVPPGSRADARAVLSTLRPGFGATRFATAVTKALEVGGSNPVHLVLVTDLQRNGWEDEQPLSVPGTLQVDIRDAGAPPPNVAVVQVRVEPERVVASLRNTAVAPFAGDVRVQARARDLASMPVRLPGGQTTEVAVPYRAGAGGSLVFSVDDSKGYPADNSRHVVVGPTARTGVLVIITAGAPHSGLYFVRALEAAPLEADHAFDVRSMSGAEASAVTADDMARYAAVVMLSTRGLDRRGRDVLAGYVRAGGGILAAAGADVEASVLSSAFGWRLEAAEEGKILALSVADVRHPVFTPFGSFAADLGQIRFERAWTIKADGWDVAARFTNGRPALIERQEGKGRAMIFASDVDRRWNEFPLHPAFVPFAAESVRHVSGTLQRARDYSVAAAPADASAEPGIYTGKDGRTFAVNVDTRESEGARLTPGEFTEMLARVDTAGAPRAAVRAQNLEAAQSLWQYGLVLMLAVLVVESAVGR